MLFLSKIIFQNCLLLLKWIILVVSVQGNSRFSRFSPKKSFITSTPVGKLLEIVLTRFKIKLISDELSCIGSTNCTQAETTACLTLWLAWHFCKAILFLKVPRYTKKVVTSMLQNENLFESQTSQLRIQRENVHLGWIWQLTGSS